VRANQGRRLPSWVIGLVLVIVVAIGAYFAFAKQLPWHHAYTVKAVFGSAQNIRPDSQVRIAGVSVGKVTDIEHLSSADAQELEASTDGPSDGATAGSTGQNAAVVTMELDDSARPIHTDASFKLRPRLFLEGNYFVDMRPGSPNAPEVDDGHVFPVNQTAYSVQLDQVLTSLQGDVRADLQTLLDQLGNAFIKYGGAEGFREAFAGSGPAFKYTSQVSESLLGTQPGDLQGVIHGLDRVVRGLGRNETTLQDLVRNFRIVAGSFTAQDVALERAIQVLPQVLDAARPAFANLNASFPAVRAFAREALPGVRSTAPTLDAATPFIAQVRALVSERELRGLVADLRPTIPRLADLADSTLGFLDQARALASCFNEVVIPWSEDTVDPLDPNYLAALQPTGRVFEETAYGLAGIAGESRSGDANGEYIRVLGSAGANSVIIPNAVPTATGSGLQSLIGTTLFPILGAMPNVRDSAKTEFKPGVACETQEQPNLQAGGLTGNPFAGPTLPPLSLTPSLAEATPKQVRTAAKAYGLLRDQVEPLVDAAGGGS
jgi:phospholipid/cholesterol/gamma-HCH transport system substrate-binding protein